MSRSWSGFLLSLLLASCGVQTVTTVSAPISSTQYLTQSDYTQLSATYSTVSTTGFQGWEVYYKIYPLSGSISGGTVSSNLASDVSSLAVTPTRDYLVSLGYQRMNGSNTSNTTVPLINLTSASNGATVNLSFASFLTFYNVSSNDTSTNIGSSSSTGLVPYITVGSTTIPVYRYVTSTTITYPYFNQLYSSTFTSSSDMASTITSGSVTPLEIDVFLVAYAFTLSNGSTYSVPEPWGVIQPLKVP